MSSGRAVVVPVLSPSASTDANVFLPPGTSLGVLGSGQLGRMFAHAAQRMGYPVVVYAPAEPPGSVAGTPPAALVTPFCTIAAYDDVGALQKFARRVRAVTVEFENIPANALDILAMEGVWVRPGAAALATAQHRLREKTWLAQHGFPVAPFHPVHALEDLAEAASRVGFPAILKTAGFGYDGKGQRRIASLNEAEVVWTGALNWKPAIWEGFVPFEREISVLVARNARGQQVAFPAFENTHAQHILDVSVTPALHTPAAICQEAVTLAQQVAEALALEGVLCVELFAMAGGQLVINEMAPRPHNSGHLTIDGFTLSQFDLQVRTLAGLPLGVPEPLAPATAMANLLGQHLPVDAQGQLAWPQLVHLLDAFPDVRFHWYGKQQARHGRKMGHLTALASDAETAIHRVLAARASLLQPHMPPPPTQPAVSSS